MKPKEMFDACYARYRTMRNFLGGHVAAVDLDSPSEGYRWRPERARAEEYVADFERIALQALARPEWKGRLKLFRLYFMRRFEYKRAMTLVGVCPNTFDYWFAEVKKTCGRAFARTGLYPPNRYFRTRESCKEQDVRPYAEQRAAAAD